MPAFAQDAKAPQASDAPAKQNEEIVVTAQFREQKLQDTPLAITAVTSAMLDSRSQTNISEVANQAPSVVLRPQGASFGPSLTATIRGLGQADFNPAYEPGVGLYIDDVYYPRLTGANFDLLDVERVEILRGPQGTITGRNSEGGAIKFISRRPNGTDGGYLQATYGSRNRIQMRGSADFTLAPSLYARVSGTFSHQEGFVDRIDYGCANPGSGIASTRAGGDCVVGKDGSVGYQAIRAMLRYNPDDRVDILLSGDYVNDSRTNPPEVLIYANLNNANTNPAPGVPYDSRFICGQFCNYATTGQPAGTWKGPVAAGFPLVGTQGENQSTYKGYGLSGNIDLKLSDSLKLTSITAYRNWKTRFNSDDDLSPANIGFGENRLTHWFWSQELRLNAKIGDIAEATVGGFYSDEKTTYFTFQDIRYAPIPLQFIGNDPVRSKSKAVFGTVIVHPAPALTLTGGIRYTDESKSYTFFRKGPDGVTPNVFLGALDNVTGRYSGNKVDYRGSVDYRFSPELLVYATVATGFKGGGIGPRPFNPAQAQPFNPEKVTSYEIGFKSDLFDKRVRFNVSGFYNKFKDAQLTLLSCPQFGGPGPCALPQNAGNADIKGFEAELAATPVEGLQIDGSLSYVKWNWKCVAIQVVRPLAAGETNACSSDPAVVGLLNPQPPIKWQWSAGIQYEIPMGTSGDTLTPRFDAAYQGALLGSTTVNANPVIAALDKIPGRTIANARLTYKNVSHAFDISVEVTNLFDHYYYQTNFDLTGAGAGLIKAQPGRPREWAITVKKKF
ncbi:TonB-dependent receptor [Novosphingobium lentum]|uniref:TonB-dependent receptor n=1 Tax=Novosphingobium lentum TaxID=145287 RepID=UPI001FE18FA9|nr:TonB-dependent receptor [Novosphingobium lentum]